MKSFFAPLAMKAGLALMAMLILALALTWIGKAAAERRANKWEQEYRIASAMLDDQNPAVKEWQAQAERREAASRKALEEARRRSRSAETLARKLEVPIEPSGSCETPHMVMEAGL